MRLLVVAMLDSVHTARWLQQFSDEGISIQLFPSTPHRRIHPLIKNLLDQKAGTEYLIRRSDRHAAFVIGLIDVFLANKIRARRLRTVLSEGNFDILHIHETQHGGYIVERLIRRHPITIPVALSIWGSDLKWFLPQVKHRLRIQSLLSHISLLFLECKDDEDLARLNGFAGVALTKIPASGGLSLEGNFESSRIVIPSKRKSIAVKGYTGFVGRADVGVWCLLALRRQLKGFQIHIYSASLRIRGLCIALKLIFGIDFYTYKKKSLQHSEILNLLAESRFSISLSESDGFPGSLRESVITGAFPIESKGSCACEWIECGVCCFVVDPNDKTEVTKAIHRALDDDDLVDFAFEKNREAVMQFEAKLIKKKIKEGFKILVMPPSEK